ncbi:TolB family protein [Fictibacillus iocasae]|uniref:TolB family protein n=1 Tax=Fictibacillus iocasae TaxID=2715437 RepID=A0ABW2NNY9_9BACL
MKKMIASLLTASTMAAAIAAGPSESVHASTTNTQKEVSHSIMKAAPKKPAPKKPAPPVVKLLEGNVTSPRWIDESHVMVTKVTDNGMQEYILNVPTKKYELIKGKPADASEMVVSHDGKHAAFLNEEGHVYIMNLKTKTSKKISEDAEIKTELQFSHDGTKLFYVAGEKSGVIAAMNVADGVITTILDDKVSYKSELQISADGKKYLYSVRNTGKVTEGQPPTEDNPNTDGDVVEVDLTGTEPQLFLFSEGKPTQLTTGTEEKENAVFLKDGRIAYMSVDMENTQKNPELKVLDPEGKTSFTAVNQLSIIQMAIRDNGLIRVLAEDEKGNKAIYQVSITGKKAETKKISYVDRATESMYYGPYGDNVSLTISTAHGEKVVVAYKKKWTFLTK